MDDLAAELYVALVRVIRTVRREVPSGGLSAGGMSALWALSRGGPQRISALAEIEGVSAASMTRLVHVLEERGLVRRTPDPTDGRAQVIATTEEGDALVTEGTEARVETVRRQLAELSEADREALLAALPALTRLSAL